MTDSKTCTKCGVEKLLQEFGTNKRVKNGRRSDCKECSKAYARAYQSANRDRVNAYNQKCYAANRGKRKARNREYRSANPHTAWESNYRMRARKFGVEPVIESFTRADLVAAYGDACAHCGGPFEHLDHYPVAVALGGAHSLDNCRPSCAACNTKQSGAIRVARR